MQTEISSLELFHMTKELVDVVGGRIDKIYQKDREFLFTMHVRGKGRKMLKIMPNAIYLTEYKEEFSETPPGFCKFLRKKTANSTIAKIEQKDFERIIEIDFEGKEDSYRMIVELFNKGNVIFCDKDYKIISALESHKWKDRTLRGGIKYEFPPSQTNILFSDEKDFAKIIKESNKDSIVKILAIDFGLGGLYAEEICALTKIDKEKKKLTAAEIKKVLGELKKLLKKKIKSNITCKEILPFDLKLFEKEEKQYFDSFSEAIDSKFSKKIISTQKNFAEEKKDAGLDKIKAIIKQQEQTIKGMGKSEKENTEKGEFIYEHYEEIKKILEDMNIARKKFSWEEIKERLKGHKVIKKINESEGTITIELK
ncbi:MAG: NFACT family protein [archaeon]